MKLLFDFFPLILFFGAYKLYGIYVATSVAIIASLGQVIWFWFRYRRFETTHLITLSVILIFGGMTLIFRDDVFIKWKPTIINWLFAVIVIGSQFLGKRTVLERLLGEKMALPAPIWKKVNLSWGLFFLVSGALNLYIAFFFHLQVMIGLVHEGFWLHLILFEYLQTFHLRHLLLNLEGQPK